MKSPSEVSAPPIPRSQLSVVCSPHFALVAMLSLVSHFCCAAEKSSLSFQQRENGEFVFDTGVLQGKLRAGGKSAGLSEVVHKRTGMRLDASMGLFSYYRVFSENHRYGTAAWDWPSDARLTAKGDVEVHWKPATDRPFELRAVYHWVKPGILDLETQVHSETGLSRFEVFLASYFSSSFTNAEVFAAKSGASASSRFIRAERSLGYWLAFPRDQDGVSIINDGRWKYEPNPVDWTILPQVSAPVGFRRCQSNGLTGLIVASAKDCFAVFTPFENEPHYSLYFSLFGRDFRIGETKRAHTRLLVEEKISEAAMLKVYRKAK